MLHSYLLRLRVAVAAHSFSFFGVQWINNVVSVSHVQQCDSGRHIYLLFHTLFFWFIAGSI